MSTPWLLYGANGYTGALIAEQAVAGGLRPVLAGRSAREVAKLAERLGLEHRVFDLSDPETVVRNLEDVELVLHTAGPFSATSRPMLDGCLRAKVDYLDITGEIDVFEACKGRDAEARRQGALVLPGVGFDVVPTDCLARALVEALPGQIRAMRAMTWLGPLLRLRGVIRVLQAIVGRLVKGPDEGARETAHAEIWGHVTAVDGSHVEGRLRTPEGYKTTVMTALACVRRVLAGEIEAGYQTPASAFGAGLIRTLPGFELEVGLVQPAMRPEAGA